jgi:hypothetical protein
MKKASIVAEVAGSLADTQMAKLNDLIEMVDFEDEDQFTGRVKSIVETYFKHLNESDDKDADDRKRILLQRRKKVMTKTMIRMLRKTVKKKDR